jgi:serine O-acetyltransferase
MLANKLASPIMPAIAIREVVEEAYAADPEMIASAACDIQAVRTRDPAVDKYSTPLLYLKGFHALQAYRIGHWLWNQGAARWRSSCKIRCPLRSRWIFTRRRKLAAGSCSTTPPALWSVKRR